MFSNYCGLGGSGPTRHKTDEACKKHDEVFQAVIEAGGEPYWHYVQGDTELLTTLMNTPSENLEAAVAKAGTLVYGAFKHLLPSDHKMLRKEKIKNKMKLYEHNAGYIMDTGDDNVIPLKKSKTNEFETPQRLSASKQPIISPDPARTFPWKELAQSNMQSNTNMDTNQASFSSKGINVSGSGDSNSNTMSNNQETAVIYHTPQYIIPDTMTVLLPCTMYFSGVLGASYQALDFSVRLNDYKAPLQTTINSQPANTAGGIGARFDVGWYRKKIAQWGLTTTNSTGGTGNTATGTTAYPKGYVPNGERWMVGNYDFPVSFPTGATQATCKGAAYYQNLYQYYTTLGCEYEIVIENTSNNYAANNDIVIARIIDTYTSDKLEGKTANVQPLGDVMAWKNVNLDKYQNHQYNDGKKQNYIIKGTYTPGMGKRMVETDGDSKRWYKTTTNVYTDGKMVEDLHLMLFPDEFNTTHNKTIQGLNDAATAGETSALKTSVNMKVTLKYIVQFKDLYRTWSEFNNEGTDLVSAGIWPMPSSQFYKNNMITT